MRTVLEAQGQVVERDSNLSGILFIYVEENGVETEFHLHSEPEKEEISLELYSEDEGLIWQNPLLSRPGYVHPAWSDDDVKDLLIQLESHGLEVEEM